MPSVDNHVQDNLAFYSPFFFGPLTGALISHGPRVLVNRAVFNINAEKTWEDSKKHITKAFTLNLLRCYSSVFMQYSIVEAQKQYLGIDYANYKIGAAILPAVGSTVVAVFVETPFIRKTTLQNSVFHSANFKLTKYSLPLTTFYFARELGFARYLFGPQDFISTPLIAGYTAIFLKWIIWAATDDRVQNASTKTMPTFPKGKVIETFKNIAKGVTYTHPTCAVPYPNSDKAHELLYNLLRVSCPAHLYSLRLLQMVVLKASMYYGGVMIAPTMANAIANQYSFWTKKLVEKPASSQSKLDAFRKNGP